jgi:hypothetical protein
MVCANAKVGWHFLNILQYIYLLMLVVKWIENLCKTLFIDINSKVCKKKIKKRKLLKRKI